MDQLRILIADDQESEILDAIKALQAAQHHVDVATKFSKALQLAKTNRYDIAIIDRSWYTDYSLPDNEPKDYKGYELVDAVREQSPDALVMLYTVHFNEPDTVKMAEKKDLQLVKKNYNKESRENLAQMAVAQAVEVFQRTRRLVTGKASDNENGIQKKKTVVTDHSRSYQIGYIGDGSIVQIGDLGTDATVIIGDNVIVGKGYQVAINKKLLDPKFDTESGNLGKELAHLRGEISTLKNLSETTRNQSITAVEEVENQVASDHPDSTRIENSLKRVKNILETAGETYEAGKPWVDRLKSVGRVLKEYLPLLKPLAAFLL